MPKLYSSDFVIKVLLKEGFFRVSQTGSHIKLRKVEAAKVLTVILPEGRKQIPHGTFRSILRQSGLSAENFER
jgi:predicted RNA binding protein YcfA (HicA-like mRNA interferase family)